MCWGRSSLNNEVDGGTVNQRRRQMWPDELVPCVQAQTCCLPNAQGCQHVTVGHSLGSSQLSGLELIHSDLGDTGCV